MNTKEVILTRRSTRKFKDQSVDQALLQQVLEAGIYAPSGGNSQSCHFLVIENKDILNQLVELVQNEFKQMEVKEGMYKSIISSINQSKKGNYNFYYNAPVLIVVANKKEYGNAYVDSACALENMMLMCNELDLGSVWINQLRWLNENNTIVSYLNQLGLNNDEIVCGALSVGYPDTEDLKPIRKALPRIGNTITYIK